VRFLEAAKVVLGQSEGPLTAAEIVQRARELGILESSGKTPERTLTADLYISARRDDSEFEKVCKQGSQRAVRGSVRWTLRQLGTV
jgi:hypothetical protein